MRRLVVFFSDFGPVPLTAAGITCDRRRRARTKWALSAPNGALDADGLRLRSCRCLVHWLPADSGINIYMKSWSDPALIRNFIAAALTNSCVYLNIQLMIVLYSYLSIREFKNYFLNYRIERQLPVSFKTGETN